MKTVHRFPLVPSTVSDRVFEFAVPKGAQTLAIAPSPQHGEMSAYCLVDTDVQETETRTIEVVSTGKPIENAEQVRYLRTDSGRHTFERIVPAIANAAEAEVAVVEGAQG